MKKYDIALFSLYIGIIAIAFGISRYLYSQEQEVRKLFSELVANQQITAVEIDAVEDKFEVFYADEDDAYNWRMRGIVNRDHLSDIYVEDGVLHLKNLKSGLSLLKVNRNIPVTITNSPRVEILSDEELARRKSETKNKNYYEF